MISSFAPVIIKKKRRYIINAFRKAGATSREKARSIKEIGLSKSILLEIQKLEGILVKVEPNYFYLDEKREKEVMGFRRILIMALIILSVLIVWYLNKG